MADTTISQLTRQTTTTSGLIVPITDGTNTVGVPISAILTTTGNMGSGAIQLPVGTTSARPLTPSVGQIRWNTTINNIEYYNGTVWTGDKISASVLLVAGGGPGGGNLGGGGGAGGFIESTMDFDSLKTYTVTVGGGGAGISGTQSGTRGSNGTNSSISLLSTKYFEVRNKMGYMKDGGSAKPGLWAVVVVVSASVGTVAASVDVAIVIVAVASCVLAVVVVVVAVAVAVAVEIGRAHV